MKHEAQQRIQDALGDLRDFQRATVTQACMRLDGPNGLHGRLLVGDEVGLGKTLVARGVVASLLSRRLKTIARRSRSEWSISARIRRLRTRTRASSPCSAAVNMSSGSVR